MFFILDRDGVINQESDAYIKSPDEWIPLPGSLEAIVTLKKQGHQVVIASNQSGVGRNLYSEETLHAIHQKLIAQLAKQNVALDGIFYCPHHPDENCPCRKPKPGLLLQIAQRFNIDLKQAICIGDSLRDIQAAQAVGATAVLVLTGNGLQTQEKNNLKNVMIFPDLAHAIDYFKVSRR